MKVDDQFRADVRRCSEQLRALPGQCLPETKPKLMQVAEDAVNG